MNNVTQRYVHLTIIFIKYNTNTQIKFSVYFVLLVFHNTTSLGLGFTVQQYDLPK